MAAIAGQGGPAGLNRGQQIQALDASTRTFEDFFHATQQNYRSLKVPRQPGGGNPQNPRMPVIIGKDQNTGHLRVFSGPLPGLLVDHIAQLAPPTIKLFQFRGQGQGLRRIITDQQAKGDFRGPYPPGRIEPWRQRKGDIRGVKGAIILAFGIVVSRPGIVGHNSADFGQSLQSRSLPRR